MKKTILSLAVLIATSVSFSAFAQRPGAPAACNNDSACCVYEQVLFEGITLTPEQQTKIKAIKDQRAKANADARKAKADERKSARDQKSNARKDARKDYLNSMKSVLTPDQYVIFLENAYVNVPVRKDVRLKDGRRAEFKKGDKAPNRKDRRAKDFKKADNAKKQEVKK